MNCGAVATGAQVYIGGEKPRSPPVQGRRLRRRQHRRQASTKILTSLLLTPIVFITKRQQELVTMY